MFADSVWIVIAAIAAIVLLVGSFAYQMHQLDVYMKQRHITTVKGAKMRMKL